MSLHSVSPIVYCVMLEVFGEKCRLASLGLLENERDRPVYLFDEKLDKEKLCQVEEMYNKIMLNCYDVRIWGEDENPDHRYWVSLSRLCPVKVLTSKNTRKIGKLSVRYGKRWVAAGK